MDFCAVKKKDMLVLGIVEVAQRGHAQMEYVEFSDCCRM